MDLYAYSKNKVSSTATAQSSFGGGLTFFFFEKWYQQSRYMALPLVFSLAIARGAPKPTSKDCRSFCALFALLRHV